MSSFNLAPIRDLAHFVEAVLKRGNKVYDEPKPNKDYYGVKYDVHLGCASSID